MTVIDLAEKKIKATQKEFLAWVEAHEVLHELPPLEFNDLRKRVFRGTFEAYRLGVTGVLSGPSLSSYFIGWLDNAHVAAMEGTRRAEVAEKCFATALEAYRVGVMVALSRRSEDLYGTSL